MRIYYTKYTFQEPAVLSEDTYKRIKKQLLLEPHFDFEPTHTPFKEKFNSFFKLLKICVALIIFTFVISIILEKIKAPRTINEINMFIAGMAFLIPITAITMGTRREMSSYDDYTIDKRKYYKGMKEAILSTDEYEEFCQIFYDKKDTKRRS